MSTRARATSMRAIRHGQQRTQIARILGWLYGAGEQGIAVPDLTPGNGFLFQDSAGTTPVTAYEQPVGRILDRSGRGNDLVQATSTKRPTLSARYNLLTYTEDFSNAAWTKYTGTTVTPDAALAPNGTITADLVYPATSGSARGVYVAFTTTLSLTTSIYAKANGKSWMQIVGSGGSSSTGVWFNVSTGAVGTQTSGYTGTITNVGNGWYRCVVSHPSQTNGFFEYRIVDNDSVSSVTANGTDGILWWGADARRTIDTIGQPAYQRVGASNDYDTAGFFPYLSFDGTAYSMATAASVDFSATAQMTVLHGVTKLSDAALGVVSELSPNAGTNFGSYFLDAPRNGATADIGFRSTGSALQDATSSAVFPAPIALVATGIGNISAPVASLRVNGAQAGNNTSNQGVGNYGNYILFVGARNNASLFFNGRIYPFFIRGAATDAGLIGQVEQFLKARMPVNF